MAKHNELGLAGELVAKELLTSKGYAIRTTNWFFKNKEIDIIAETDDYLVIVEVKTRSSLFEAEAHQTVGPKKQKFLVQAADSFLNENNIIKETRFDIVSVLFTDNEVHTEHLENAFYPTL